MVKALGAIELTQTWTADGSTSVILSRTVHITEPCSDHVLVEDYTCHFAIGD